jgi:hypothetical protein
MEKKEIMLVGADIHKFVERLCNQFLGDSPDMTDGEKNAYKLGIENVLRLLKQTTDEMFNDGLVDYDQYLVHVPGLDVVTEYASIEEIQNRNKAD